MEQISTFFSIGWLPAQGLSPIVDIWFRNWDKKITWWILTEIGWWFYIYNFDDYSSDSQYLYLFDGWATLSTPERYRRGSNEMDAYTNKISWWRTAATITNYTPDFDELKKLIDSKEYKQDDTKILKAIKGIKLEKYKPVDVDTPIKKLEGKLLTSEMVRSTVKEEIKTIPNLKQDITNIENTVDNRISQIESKLDMIVEKLWLQLDRVVDSIQEKMEEKIEKVKEESKPPVKWWRWLNIQDLVVNNE